MDTDVVFNNHNLSLSNLISNLSWVNPSKCKDFQACHFAFVYDTWRKKDSFVVPNSGIFLFRSTYQTRQLVQLWWHLNMHESNFHGFYEQDSLWNLLENIPSPAARRPSSDELANRKRWNSQIKNISHNQNLAQYIGILDMITFGNTNRSQFFVHMTSGLGTENRQPELRNIWRYIQSTSNRSKFFINTTKQSLIEFDATNDRIPWNISL